MKNKNTILMIISAFTLMAVIFQACNNDSEPQDLNIDSMTVGDLDLNSADSPDNVPVDAGIEITFNSNINEETATSNNITLVQDYDEADIPLDISVDGTTLTLQPEEVLAAGTLYQLNLRSGLLNSDDQPLGETSRTFSTAGTFTPSGAIAHWTFEDSPDDIVGNYDASAEIDIDYTASRNDEAGLAATFNGNTSIIEIPNGDDLMNAEEFTLSFWVRTNSEGHVNENGDPAGHFVMGLAAHLGFQFEIPADYSWMKIPASIELTDGTIRGGGDLFWNGDGMTRDNDGWQGTTLNDEEDIESLAKDTWMHVTYLFNGPEKIRSLYVNGEPRIEHDFSLWPEDAEERMVIGMAYGGEEPDVYPELAFGFVHSRAGTMWDEEPWGGYDIPTANHFKGQLDDVKIYHQVLTETEIQLMYASEN
ncbi:MAG: Ig-like domain-containing protein [Balneolaceae bacterium]